MGSISQEHAEWAVVDRMRQMMEEPKGEYLATQTYAMFSAILCWVLQHLRINPDDQGGPKDVAAIQLLGDLAEEPAADAPWSFPVSGNERIEAVGAMEITVPGSVGFDGLKAKDLLCILRDAMAHGDARNVHPFNFNNLLLGFTFHHGARRITLLRSDMRRIGSVLATRYRDAIVAAGQVVHGQHFPAEATDMLEPQLSSDAEISTKVSY